MALQYVLPSVFSLLFRIFGLGAKSKKCAVLGFFVLIVVSVLPPMILIPLLGYNVYKCFVPFVMLVANLSVFIVSSDGFLQTCFLQLSQANITFYISITAASLRRFLNCSYFVSDGIRLLLCCVALFLGLRYCAKPMRFMADIIHTGWVGLLAIPACVLLAVCSVSIYFSELPFYPPLFMIAVMTLLELSFVLYVRGLYYSLRELERLTKEQKMQYVLQSELLAYDDAVMAAKRSRHDLRHHNAVILEYLRAGDIASAEKYLHSTDEQTLSSMLIQFCENHVANAIFRIYDRRCRKAGVCLTVEGNIPEEVPLTPAEMGSLIGNLLENAMNACQKVEVAPYITVKFHVKDDTLCGSVENSVSEEVRFSSGTPQSQRSGGGAGTKSIAAVLQRHDGAVRWHQECNVFYAQIMLPL